MNPQQLSYQDMALDPSGQIMSKEVKASLRKQYGYCLTCPSVPTLLYDIQKARLNPLWSNKIPRTVDGVCFEGKCFQCNPRLRHLHVGAAATSGSAHSLLEGGKSVHSSGSAERRSSRRLGRDSRRSVVKTEASSSSLVSTESRRKRTSGRAQSGRSVSVTGQGGAREDPRPSSRCATENPGSSLGGLLHSNEAQRRPSNRVDNGSAATHSFRCSDSDATGTTSTIVDAVPVAALLVHQGMSTTSLELTDDDVDFSMHDGDRDTTTVTVSPPPRSRRSPPVRSVSEESLVLVPNLDDSMLQRPASLSPAAWNHPMAGIRVPPRSGSRRHVGSLQGLPSSHHASSSCASSIHSSTMEVSRSAAPPLTEEAMDYRNHQSFCTSHDDVLALSVDAAGELERSEAATVAEPCRDDESAIQDLRTLVRDMQGDENLGILTEILISSLDLHQTSERVQAYVLQAMADLFRDTVTESSVLISKILRAMTDFAPSLPVQVAGCRALQSLASNAGNTGILVRTGACTALAASLARHIGDADLVAVAVAALRMLSVAWEARELLQQNNVAGQVAQAMQCNPEVSALQRDGCALLSNIAVEPESRTVSPVGNSVLEAVVGALKGHDRDPTVTASSCFALKNFSYESTNVSALAKIPGICETVQRATTIGGGNDALVVLERLQMAQAEAESLQDQTLAAIINTDSIEDVVNAMKSNCRSPKVVQESMKALTALVRSSQVHKTVLQQDSEVLACMLQCSELYASDLQIQDLTRTLMDAMMVFDHEEPMETSPRNIPAQAGPERQMVNTD